MKLVHPHWEHSFNFDLYNTYCLIIENPTLLREYLIELRAQVSGEDGLFVLSHDNKELTLSDHVVILSDLLFFEIADRKLTSRIQGLLKRFIVSSDMYEETQELISSLLQYAESIADKFDYPVTYNEVDYATLVKLLGFDVKYEYDSPLEKLIEYFDLAHDICNLSIFVLVNPSTLFIDEEIKSLTEHCMHMGHKIIAIEASDPDSSKFYERKIIIDEDACELF